jgi:hypothetical protein
MDELLADKRYFWKNLVGKGGDETKGPERMEVQADLIWKPGMSYFPQCNSNYWLAIDYGCPLLAHKYKMNVVIYLDMPAEQTLTFSWTGQDVVRTESKVGVLQFPDLRMMSQRRRRRWLTFMETTFYIYNQNVQHDTKLVTTSHRDHRGI